MLGKSETEICKLLNLTRSEFKVAKRWIARRWTSNEGAYADFLISESGRLEVLQARINALLADELTPEYRKTVGVAKLVALMHQIEFNIREMGLRLGILDREEFKVKETREYRVSFGDEETVAWFSDKNAPPMIDVSPGGATV